MIAHFRGKRDMDGLGKIGATSVIALISINNFLLNFYMSYGKFFDVRKKCQLKCQDNGSIRPGKPLYFRHKFPGLSEP